MNPPNFTCNIEINIEGHKSGHFVYQILMDGYPYETGEACSTQAALTAAALWLTRKCKKCGCTFLHGCCGEDSITGNSCYWVNPDLCSHCIPKKKGAKS